MLPPITPELFLQMEVAFPTAVGVVALSRFYFGGVLFAPRWTAVWATLRKILVPILDTLVRNRIPGTAGVSLTNKAVETEIVGLVDRSPTQLGKQLSTCRDVEVPLLAGYKTDWCDRKEAGTLVWYYGSKPFPTAPNWVRPYQVHLTLFPVQTDDGLRWLIVAHREANPYRPDLWVDHLLKGTSHSVEDGVRRAERALGDADIAHDPDHPAITEC